MEDFSSMCACLEEDVCTYINTIAKIVHENVVACKGAPNKNMGNAFFCVWKFEEDLRLEHEPGSPTSPSAPLRRINSPMSTLHVDTGPQIDESSVNQFRMQARLTSLSDCALSSVVKTRIDLQFRNFKEFTKREKVVEKFGNDFQVGET